MPSSPGERSQRTWGKTSWAFQPAAVWGWGADVKERPQGNWAGTRRQQSVSSEQEPPWGPEGPAPGPQWRQGELTPCFTVLAACAAFFLVSYGVRISMMAMKYTSFLGAPEGGEEAGKEEEAGTRAKSSWVLNPSDTTSRFNPVILNLRKEMIRGVLRSFHSSYLI